MINMSFYNRTLRRDELKKFIQNTDKQIVFTYGFEYRNPTTHRKPVSSKEALEIVDKYSLLDARESDSCLHLNAFSANDMI